MEFSKDHPINKILRVTWWQQFAPYTSFSASRARKILTLVIPDWILLLNPIQELLSPLLQETKILWSQEWTSAVKDVHYQSQTLLIKDNWVHKLIRFMDTSMLVSEIYQLGKVSALNLTIPKTFRVLSKLTTLQVQSSNGTHSKLLRWTKPIFSLLNPSQSDTSSIPKQEETSLLSLH